MIAIDDNIRLLAASRPEGPAVLRLRMLALGHDLRLRRLDASARADAEAALAALRAAVLTRPADSLADALARARTLADVATPETEL